MKITYKEVLEASICKNVEIATGLWISRNECNTSACPLGCLYIAENGLPSKWDNTDTELGIKVSDWADDKYGLDFTEGFIDGYDAYMSGDTKPIEHRYSTKELKEGYRNGRYIAMRKCGDINE